MKHCSHPTNPRSRSSNHRAEPWADCMTKFGVRKCQIMEKYHKLFEYPDAYDFARGLTLDGHSSPPSSASEA